MTAATEEDVKFIMDEISADRDFVVTELEGKGITVLK